MKLIDALSIIQKRPGPEVEQFRVALVCGFTPLHLQTYLHAELQQLFPAQRVELTPGVYGDIPGTLSALKRGELQNFAGAPVDALALVLEWSDIDARLGTRQLGGWGPGNLNSVVDHATTWLAQLQLLVAELSHSVPIALSLPSLPLPPLFFTAGQQAGYFELKLKEQLAAFAASIAHRVRVLSEQRLDRDSPWTQRLSIKSEWASGFPYQLAHASALAHLLAQIIRNPLPKKGLITDLDNTLWNGIVGEVGAQEINWDLDHNSQAYGVYQQMLQTLSDEGVLIGVVSKNEPAVVEEAFRRDDLLLSRDKISLLDVSWGSKAKAVSQILGVWNVGGDSVVFVDDSPLELAEVKAAHPDLECIRFPEGDPEAIYELLVHLRDLFGKGIISEEDQLRQESIRNSATLRLASDDSEGFSEVLLEQAKAELIFSFRKDAEDSRAFELINKTNQFNLNGKRFTEAAWRNYLHEPNTFLLTASYKDRFGALGKIAVMAGRLENSEVFVDTWVMSCRAFARRIEHQCLSALFSRFAAPQITFDYVETPRNGPTARFFSDVLKESPESAVPISQISFAAACPKLFHRVVVLDS